MWHCSATNCVIFSKKFSDNYYSITASPKHHSPKHHTHITSDRYYYLFWTYHGYIIYTLVTIHDNLWYGCLQLESLTSAWSHTDHSWKRRNFGILLMTCHTFWVGQDLQDFPRDICSPISISRISNSYQVMIINISSLHIVCITWSIDNIAAHETWCACISPSPVATIDILFSIFLTPGPAFRSWGPGPPWSHLRLGGKLPVNNSVVQVKK